MLILCPGRSDIFSVLRKMDLQEREVGRRDWSIGTKEKLQSEFSISEKNVKATITIKEKIASF